MRDVRFRIEARCGRTRLTIGELDEILQSWRLSPVAIPTGLALVERVTPAFRSWSGRSSSEIVKEDPK